MTKFLSRKRVSSYFYSLRNVKTSHKNMNGTLEYKNKHFTLQSKLWLSVVQFFSPRYYSSNIDNFWVYNFKWHSLVYNVKHLFWFFHHQNFYLLVIGIWYNHMLKLNLQAVNKKKKRITKHCRNRASIQFVNKSVFIVQTMFPPGICPQGRIQK